MRFRSFFFWLPKPKPVPLIDITRKRAALRRAHHGTRHLAAFAAKLDQLQDERNRGVFR